MIKNFLKLAWRNIWKHKQASLINIGGLAIGIAACLLIGQYIRYELSYDDFYRAPEEVFRVNTIFKEGAKEERYATAPPPLKAAILEDIPEVEAACRVFNWSDFTMRPDDDFDKVFRETNVYAADASFFEVLDYGLLEGDPETALAAPASVVLPRSAAVRYFGEEAVQRGNVVGRKLLGGKDAGTPWQVTGLMADQPENSHFQFDFLISASTYPDDIYRNQNWSWNIMHTYVRLQEGVAGGPSRMNALQNKLDALVRKRVLPALGEEPEAFLSGNNQLAFRLQPLEDIHLRSSFLREMQPNGSLAYVRILGLVAIFILLIACVNYINLYTAQSFRRAAEVGIKKVMGASRRMLAGQFLMESFLSVGLALLLALSLLEGLRVVLAQYFLPLPFTHHFDFGSLLASALILLLVAGILSGAYPALYISYFRPAEVLKGKKQGGYRDLGIRNGLVVLQFVLSIGLLVGTLAVQKQLSFIQNKKLGFEKENVLVIENDREIDERMEAFKEELRRHPGVLNASFSNGIPALPRYQMRDFRREGAEDSYGINWYQVDETHLETLGMELKAGRGFDREIASDSSGLLLNEQAVHLLGLKAPIGTYLIKNKGAEDEEKLKVLGVVEDFHLESFHQEVKPLALQYFKGFVFKDYISVRLAGGNPSAAVEHVKESWKRFEPGVPLRYSFLDASYDKLYKSERTLSRAFALFAGLAVLIACLGLFGLVAHVAQQRTKEIGIRKVLGATAAQIVKLLAGDFLRLVLIALLIAIPLSWWAVSQWLQGFAYRVSPGWEIFAISGALAIVIALLTVSLQALRAALADPVEALRRE